MRNILGSRLSSKILRLSFGVDGRDEYMRVHAPREFFGGQTWRVAPE